MNHSLTGELLDQVDMESYLDREGVKYRVTPGARGVQLNLRECPVCGNNDWKVYLNAASGLGNCFAGDHPTDENFNKYAFIKALQNITCPRQMQTHLRTVAREMGWRARKTHSAVVEIDGKLTLPDSYAIPIQQRNIKYLEQRHIDKALARYFHLRYCHEGDFKYRFEGKNLRQNYSKRVIVPIFDLDGLLVSFQGRDVTGRAEKKYLFPPGFAATGRHLFNAHNAHGAKRLLICEGVFDVMSAKLAMDEEMALREVAIVGSFGKHLSSLGDGAPDQLAVILALKHQGLKEVTFMWDAEKRALADAARTAMMLQRYGLVCRVAVLPANKDPNEVTGDELRKAFWQAIHARRYNMTRLIMGIKR